jgi:hypothetical protein
VKIGTWNLQGSWKPQHLDFVVDADCDVWLFTEVNERVEIDGYGRHWSTDAMRPKIRWASIYSRRPLSGLPDPHIASAAAVVEGTTYCSSILPWQGSGRDLTWPGEGHSGMTEEALVELLRNLPTVDLVWGGDWNHALSGIEMAGSKRGRDHVIAAVDRLRLNVPTADLSHWIDGHLSIDHIAVPADREVISAERIVAKGLSDHDCYVVELADA